MTTVIDLGKLRFLYRGTYSSSTTYDYNDVVKSGGNSYVYINNTASSGSALTDANYWSALVDGMNSTGAWSSATEYGINDLVTHGGAIYRCTAVNTNQVPPNSSYWEAFVQGYNHRGAWNAAGGVEYEVDDSVVLLGESYRCITRHTSTAGLDGFLADIANWNVYAAGTLNRGTYAHSTVYFSGNLVTFGTAPSMGVYICTADHTSHATDNPTDTAAGEEGENWDIWVSGQTQDSAAIKMNSYFFALL